MSNLVNQASKLPPKPGVYQFLDDKGLPIYIGKAKDLRKRAKSYFLKGVRSGPKTASMLTAAKKIKYFVVDSEIDALILEAVLIKKFQPKYNSAAKDDKSHLYIKITVGEKIPRVTTARREKETANLRLFGPFPQAAVVKSVLKVLRRIFPFVTQKHSQKKLVTGRIVFVKCLYCHLGLCPGYFESDEKIKEYRKTITKIILFLSGKRKKLINNLKGEMNLAAKKLEFEKAQELKKQIEGLEYITTPARNPEEYLRQPDLVEDIARQKLLELAKILNLKKIPVRIECYDISNMAGIAATGSLVVFVNGIKAPEWYRRFMIKNLARPNDVTMMSEVLERRFANSWPQPDLIIVDGGKAQLGAVGKVLSKLGILVPYISLAKKQEEIFVAGQNQSIKLGKDSPALQLLQAVRDEAHRFAISYHRKLRSKILLAGFSQRVALSQ